MQGMIYNNKCIYTKLFSSMNYSDVNYVVNITVNSGRIDVNL